jgi:hypothetical protein
MILGKSSSFLQVLISSIKCGDKTVSPSIFLWWPCSPFPGLQGTYRGTCCQMLFFRLKIALTRGVGELKR